MSSERRSLFDPPQIQAEVIQENLNQLKQQEAIAKVRLENAKRLADQDESWHVKRSRQRREKRHRLETRREAVEAHKARQRAAARRARRERGATVTPSPTPSEAEAETARQAAARAARKVRAARRGHRRSVAALLLADAHALQWREVTMADASGHWIRGAREQHGGRPRDHFAMAVRRTSSLTSNELLVRKASKWINKRHAEAARRRRGDDDVSGGGGGSGGGDDSDGGDDGGDDDDSGIATDTSDGGPDNSTPKGATPKASKLNDPNRWDDTEGEDDSSGDKTPEPGPSTRGRPGGGNRGGQREARGNRGTKGGSRSGTKKGRKDRSRRPSTSGPDELAGEETAPKRTRNAAARSTRATRSAPDGNTGSKKPEKADAVRRLRNEEEEEAERDRNATVQKFRQIMEPKGWRPDARVSSAIPRPPSSPEKSTEEEEPPRDEGAEGIPTSSDPSPDKETEQPPEDPEEEDDGDVLAKRAIVRASVEDEDPDDSSKFDEDESDASEESEHGYDELDRELGEHNDEWWDDLGKVAQAYASEFTAPEYEWPSESINTMGAVATKVEPSLSGVASTRRSSSSSGNTCDSKAPSTASQFLDWVREMRNPHELESALDKAYRVENDNANSRERHRATGEAVSATSEPPLAGYIRAVYDTNLEDLSSAAKGGEYDFRHYKAEDIHNKHFPGNLGPNIPSGDRVLSYPVGARSPDPNVYDPMNWEKHADFDEMSLRGGKRSSSEQDIRVKDGAWMSWEETLKAYPRLDDIRRLDHAWESLAAIQPSENMSNEEMMDITAVTIKHWPAKAAYIGPGSSVSEAAFFPLDANNTASARRRLSALPAPPEPIKGLSIQGPPEPASRNWSYGGSAEAPRIKVEDDVTGRPLRPLPTEEELRNATPINNDIFPKAPLAPENQEGEDELRERLRETRQREEAEARRKAEEDAPRQQEARADAEEEARSQGAARQKAEEAARQAEEARKEARRQQEARQNEEEEARHQEAARQRAEEEAARRSDEARKEAARRKAEEARGDAGESQRQTQQTTGPNNSEDADQRAADIADITAAMENNTALKALLKLKSPFNMDGIADRYVAYRAAIRKGLEPGAGTKRGRDDEDGQAGGDSKRTKLASDTGVIPSLTEFKASLPPEERANDELAEREWYRLVFKATKPEPEPKTPAHAPPPPPGLSDNATAQAQETAGDTDLGSTENVLSDPDYTELLIQQTLLPGLSDAAGEGDSRSAATTTTHHRQTGGPDRIPGIDDGDGDGGDENGDEDEADALLAKKNVQFDLGRNEEYDDDDDGASAADGGESSDSDGRGGGGGRDDYGYYGGRIPGAGRSRLSDSASRAARRAIYSFDTDPWKPSFDSYWKQGEERRVAAPPEESGGESGGEKEERRIDWLFG
ncbi:hypothetical protein DL766_010539 [Monosporascus sp. MC13-8B]|uniref:Uncharacterized protein n=1 Tax=Monosporascus cannonballus TaxID=155416 RepID=A0ABY0HLQ8_9PEZI|nr:hypothetical protein DL762_001054 [Monosporascus cannonballus]RYP00123.1 hypothetical protein DL763_001052 [Monosporascus cannonballus]RYP02046.1 hypothetical protein DL766_010539 [Monosporascus sp. MC13-8B]